MDRKGRGALIAAALARAASRAAGVLADCYRAQQRCMVLALAPDRQLDKPDQAPQTYAEFLFRTSGPLLREPAARDRSARRTGP